MENVKNLVVGLVIVVPVVVLIVFIMLYHPIVMLWVLQAVLTITVLLIISAIGFGYRNRKRPQ